MTEGDIRVATLASIVESSDAAWRLHGVDRVDPVVPAGYYRRRRMAGIDVTDLLPSETIFKLYSDNLFQPFGPLRRFVLREALLTDQGAVVTRGGALLNESCWEFLLHGHLPYGLAPRDADHFRLTEQPTARVRAPTLLLKRPWWRNYGHWLIDAAALLALLVARQVGGFEQIVIGAPEDPKLRALFREMLSCVAPDLPVLEHADPSLWQFAELHYVQPVRRPPLCTLPEAVEALRVAVLGPSPPPAGDRRLFVSRRHYGRRRLDNEATVLDVCERHGFEVTYPEQGTLREQAALFRSASAVVGVKGAALANLIFAPPAASVIVLAPGDFADPFFWDIAGARDLSYSEIFGKLVTAEYGQAQNPFTIDPVRLDALMGAVLPPRVASAPQTPAAVAASDIAAATFVPPELTGESYQSCLARIHARTRPRTYFEIGTLRGETLALSRCRSVAIDPAFQLESAVPGGMPSLFLFQGQSDAFFETIEARAVLGGPIDLAFLDGMHLFECLLRDFINTERLCHRGSIVVLHDCIPLDIDMTDRDKLAVQARPDARYPGWWTGDAWKTVDILMRHRPDLDIIALDAPPTGLIVVRNLDPSSTRLESDYDTIVQSYAGRPNGSALAEYLRSLRLCSTSIVDLFEPIATDGGVEHPGKPP